MLIRNRPLTLQSSNFSYSSRSNQLCDGLVFLTPPLNYKSNSFASSAERPWRITNEYTDTLFQLTENIGSRWGGLFGLTGLYANTQLLFPTTELNASFSATGQATFVGICRSTSSGKRVVTLGNSTAGGEYYPYTDNKIYLGPFSSTRWVEALVPPSDIAVPQMISATYKSGAQSFRYNNVEAATNTLSGTPTCSAAAFGQGNASGVHGGFLYFGAFWNRALTPTELSEIYGNPWQLYANRRIYIPTATAASSVPTLSDLRPVNLGATSTQWSIDYTF